MSAAKSKKELSVITSERRLQAMRTPPKLKPGTHRFFQTTLFHCSPERVFEFFSDPQNLKRTTPPELKFQLLAAPEKIREGSALNYRLRIGWFSIRWQTRVLLWHEPEAFLDVQASGPFDFWRHKHVFTPEGSGVRMDDEILYRMPAWPLGEIAHWWVAKKLRRIFTYRKSVMQALLNE